MTIKQLIQFLNEIVEENEEINEYTHVFINPLNTLEDIDLRTSSVEPDETDQGIPMVRLY